MKFYCCLSNENEYFAVDLLHLLTFPPWDSPASIDVDMAVDLLVLAYLGGYGY